MSDRLQELTTFVRTAESGSFSRAARALNLSQPSVSRIVSDLEARLGVKLLLRTTRRMTLTDAGAAFLERAKQIVHDLEAAEAIARGIDSLRGTIRMALPITFGVRQVIPRLRGFLAAHPLLRLDLIMSDERQDLVADGVDVAIRLGHLASSGFGARRLATARRLLVASSEYTTRRGQPTVPADLAAHDCIFGPGLAARQHWAFRHDSAADAAEPDVVEVEARVTSTSAEGMMACIRAGFGLGIASDWMCGADLETGEVVHVMPGYRLAPIEVHAVYPAGPHPSAKVRAVVDVLAAGLV